MQRLFMALIAGAIFIAGGTTLANTPKKYFGDGNEC